MFVINGVGNSVVVYLTTWEDLIDAAHSIKIVGGINLATTLIGVILSGCSFILEKHLKKKSS